MKPTITLLLCMAEKGFISTPNFSLPFNCDDYLDFIDSNITMDDVVLMGRKTYEFIGMGLPFTNTVVLSKKKIFKDAHNLKDINLLKQFKKNTFVIGGVSVISECLNKNLLTNAKIFMYNKRCTKNGSVKLSNEQMRKLLLLS